MIRLFLFESLCSFHRKASVFILSAAMLLCACGEQNDGMQSLASREVPFIYALGNRGGQAVLIIANEDGYYREYPISGAVAPYDGNMIGVSKSGRVYISQADSVFTSSSEDYSSWSSQALGNNVLGIVSTPFGDYLLQQTQVDAMYRYEKSVNSWMSIAKTTNGAPEEISYSDIYYKLYVIDDFGGAARLYELGTPSALVLNATYNINVTRNFLTELNGGIYIGNSSEGLYINGVLIGAGSGLASYAIVSPSDIFAGTDSASLPLRVFRLIGGSFVPEIQFSGATGFIKLWPLPPDRIIVGIGDVSSSNGLYMYDFKKRYLKAISSLSVYAVYSSSR